MVDGRCCGCGASPGEEGDAARHAQRPRIESCRPRGCVPACAMVLCTQWHSRYMHTVLGGVQGRKRGRRASRGSTPHAIEHHMHAVAGCMGASRKLYDDGVLHTMLLCRPMVVGLKQCCCMSGSRSRAKCRSAAGTRPGISGDSGPRELEVAELIECLASGVIGEKNPYGRAELVDSDMAAT